MKRLWVVLLLSSCIDRLPEPGSDEGPAVAIQCLEDSQCPADRPACVEQVCQPCASNAYCTANAPVCHNNLCIACLENGDCPEGKAVCREQQCIDCTEDAHCTESNPVCIDEACVACRVDADCPLERALCVNASCVLDPDGRAAWAHRDVVLPGATTLHSVNLNTTIELEYLHRLVPMGWTVDPIEEQDQIDWGRVISQQGDRIAVHRSGLVIIAPHADATLLENPNPEGLTSDDPQLRADLRGFLGFQHLHKLVKDLNDAALLSTGNPLSLLNNSSHHLVVPQDKHILVQDIVFGDPSDLVNELGSEVWAKLSRRAWGHPVVQRPSAQQTSTHRRNVVVDLAEPGTLRVDHIFVGEIYTGFFWDDPHALRSGELGEICPSILSASIDDNSVVLSPDGIAIPAGRHTIAVEAATAQNPECETNTGRIKADTAPTSWWRFSIESNAALGLIGWDQDTLTTSSYNANTRPITVSLLASGIVDTDRDGWPDSSDLCPTVPDDMKDADQDGKGDRCDGVMSTQRISESVLAALDANNEELYRTEAPVFHSLSLWTAPFARAGTFPHREGFHGLASEQALIIKPNYDTPLRVLDGSGQPLLEMFEDESVRLDMVGTDGLKLVVMGRQYIDGFSTTFGHNMFSEKLLRFVVTGMQVGSQRFFRDFKMHARRGNFIAVPRTSVTATLASEPVMTLITTQEMLPLHVARMPGALIPGFNGTCYHDGHCRDGRCHFVSCTLGDDTDRCPPNEDNLGYCTPNEDLGYCIRREGGILKPSSFRSCSHARGACTESRQCPGTQLCVTGHCKDICRLRGEACSEAEECVGEEIPGLAEVGVCATYANDESCEGGEVCMAGSDLVHDLPNQFYIMPFMDRSLNAGAINGAMVINLKEKSLQSGQQTSSYGEFTWCLRQLINSRENSLSEPESRLTLRRLFDRRTPWSEIFGPGQFTSNVHIYKNVFGINHALTQSCGEVLSPWSLEFPKQLKPVTLELVDLNRDHVDELRIGFSLTNDEPTPQTPALLWRCYDLFGERITSNCAP